MGRKYNNYEEEETPPETYIYSNLTKTCGFATKSVPAQLKSRKVKTIMNNNKRTDKEKRAIAESGKPKCFGRSLQNKNKCSGGWGFNCNSCSWFLYRK